MRRQQNQNSKVLVRIWGDKHTSLELPALNRYISYDPNFTPKFSHSVEDDNLRYGSQPTEKYFIADLNLKSMDSELIKYKVCNSEYDENKELLLSFLKETSGLQSKKYIIRSGTELVGRLFVAGGMDPNLVNSMRTMQINYKRITAKFVVFVSLAYLITTNVNRATDNSGVSLISMPFLILISLKLTRFIFNIKATHMFFKPLGPSDDFRPQRQNAANRRSDFQEQKAQHPVENSNLSYGHFS